MRDIDRSMCVDLHSTGLYKVTGGGAYIHSVCSYRQRFAAIPQVYNITRTKMQSCPVLPGLRLAENPASKIMHWSCGVVVQQNRTPVSGIGLLVSITTVCTTCTGSDTSSTRYIVHVN